MNVEEKGNTEAKETKEAVVDYFKAIEEEEEVAPVVPKTAIPNSIVFHWYQPEFAATYSGLRRYGAGDMV